MYHRLDREIELVEKEYEEGKISRKEMDAEIRELQRSYQAAAEEAAMDAYNRELESW